MRRVSWTILQTWRLRTMIGGAAVLLGAMGLSVPEAQAFLGADEYNISGFCNEPAQRRTIIYIDDQILEDGNTGWANRLYQKLITSLLPSEPVAVVQLSPGTGNAKELW